MDPKTLRNRIRKVFGYAEGINKILLVNTNTQDPNFIYMTDFEGGLYEDSFLIVERYGVTLFTDMREYEAARKQAIAGMKVVKLDGKKKLDTLTSSIRGREVGINGAFLPYRKYMNLRTWMKPKRLVDVSEAFSKTREVKDSEEIKRIREANKITKKAISKIQKKLKVGVTEKKIAIEFDRLMADLGSQGPSFSSIICFGRNAAIPHHTPGETKLRRGDFVLIDVGGKVKNYCADVTRTIIFGKGKDYDKKMIMIKTVKDAQREAVAAIKEGVQGGEVDRIVRDRIDGAEKGRYRGAFGHALGHSIGIEVHDGTGRFLSHKSKLILKEGMVTSVEPGIYIPGFGGVRIEDDVLVTKKGAVIL